MHSWNEDLAHVWLIFLTHANSDSTSTQQNSAPLKSGTATCNYAAIYCELNMNHGSLSKNKNYEYYHRLATGKLQGLSV